MFLIFGWGWRHRQIDTVSLTCPRCGQAGAHPLFKQVLRLSIFFVPLIPLRTRYTLRCPNCGLSTDTSADAVRAR